MSVLFIRLVPHIIILALNNGLKLIWSRRYAAKIRILSSLNFVQIDKQYGEPETSE